MIESVYRQDCHISLLISGCEKFLLLKWICLMDLVQFKLKGFNVKKTYPFIKYPYYKKKSQ